MPLARIITKHADEALELAMQLRARGFQVETMGPDEIAQTPPDLEIQLDACDAEQVLAQVMEWSSEDISVFVTPGSLSGKTFEMADFDRIPKYGHPISSNVIQPMPSEAGAIQEADIEELKPEPAIGEVVLKEPVLKEPVVEEPLVEQPLVEQPLVEQSIVEESILERPVSVLQSRQQTDVRIVEAAMEPEASLQSESVAIDKPTREIHQSSEASPIVMAEESGREHSPLVTGKASRPESFEYFSPAPVNRTEAMRPAPSGRASAVMGFAKRRSDQAFWRIAIAAAGLAALVVVIGSAWQQRHPAAGALPTSGAQQIPFQKPAAPSAIGSPAASGNPSVQPAQSDLQKSAAPASAAKTPVAISKPAAPKKPAVAPDERSTASTHRVSQKPKVAQHKATVHTGESGMVAKDTVVYFDRKPTAATSTGPNTKQ